MKSKKPRMVIVGNALIKENLSEFIDSSDVVVRFNYAFYYGFNTGYKVDILCANNSGPSALSFANSRELFKKKISERVSEIWFPRDIEYHKEYITKNNINFKLTESYDYSQKIIKSNNLDNKIIRKFSRKLNKTVYDKILSYNHNPEYFICPSTGIMALEYIVSEERFSEFDKILVGFTFEGWKGHAWNEERKIVLAYTENRQDFKLMPAKQFKYDWMKKLIKIKIQIIKKLKKW